MINAEARLAVGDDFGNSVEFESLDDINRKYVERGDYRGCVESELYC